MPLGRRFGSAGATAMAVAVLALSGISLSAPTAAAETPAQPAKAASGTAAKSRCAAKPQLQAQPATAGAPITVASPLTLPGSRVSATARGYQANEKVQVVLYDIGGDPTTVTADRKGRVQVDLAVPELALAGWHRVQFTGWCAGRIAVGAVLVGRVGGGPWPGTGYPDWAPWTALAIGAGVIASLGLLAFHLWRHREQGES